MGRYFLVSCSVEKIRYRIDIRQTHHCANPPNAGLQIDKVSRATSRHGFLRPSHHIAPQPQLRAHLPALRAGPHMSLDPIMKAFLEQMTSQPAPKLNEVPPPVGREMMRAMIQLIGANDVPIGKVVNRTCPGPGGPIPIRFYSPVASGGDPLPALIYFHGGGFVIGDLETHDGLCRMLANEGGVHVIAVDYRLAPEHKFPAAVEDAFAAVEWVEANASDLGIDANRLAVGGDSAGGNLAAVVAQMAKEKGAPSIAYQMLFFPVTQARANTKSMRDCAEGYFLERATMDWFFNNYLGASADTSDLRISPLLAKDVSGLPPAYVMLAGYDPLHDEGLAYAEKLKAAGVNVTVADYPGLVHDFIFFQAVLPQASEAMKSASAALKGALAAG
jgi:acetyl esterase